MIFTKELVEGKTGCAIKIKESLEARIPNLKSNAEAGKLLLLLSKVNKEVQDEKAYYKE